TEIVFQQRKLDAAARERGVSVIPDCGLAPGMVNILAAEGIRRVAEAESVKVYVGGLPQHPAPPLNYQIVYSLEGALDYYTTASWVLRDGRPTRVDALSELEQVTFPPPVGVLEAFHTGGGISILPWTYEGKVRTMEYKTLRYPGHVAVMRPIRELGLLDLTPVKVKGKDVAPRDLATAAVVEPPGREPHCLARTEHPPGIEERHELELHDLELGRGRDPEDQAACLERAQQLAAAREPAVVVAAQRAVATDRDERALARFHQLLRRERGIAARTLRGQAAREHQALLWM